MRQEIIFSFKSKRESAKKITVPMGKHERMINCRRPKHCFKSGKSVLGYGFILVQTGEMIL